MADDNGTTTVMSADNQTAETTFSINPETQAADATSAAATGATTAAPDFISLVPEAYRKEEFVKNILESGKDNKAELLFEQFKNAQKLVGQKSGLQVPGETATEDERKEFFKAIGVSDNLDDYTPEKTTWSEADKAAGEYLESIHDEKMLTDMKTVAQKLGITPKQFKGLNEHYNKAFVEQHKTVVESLKNAEQQLDDDFNSITTELFGDSKLKVLEEGKRYIDKFVPEGTKARDIYNNMTNEQAAVVAAGLWMAAKGLTKEDSVFNRGQGTTHRALTAAEHREEGAKLRRDPAYKNTMDPGHEAAVARVNAHYSKENIPKERFGT